MADMRWIGRVCWQPVWNPSGFRWLVAARSCFSRIRFGPTTPPQVLLRCPQPVLRIGQTSTTISTLVPGYLARSGMSARDWWSRRFLVARIVIFQALARTVSRSGGERMTRIWRSTSPVRMFVWPPTRYPSAKRVCCSRLRTRALNPTSRKMVKFWSSRRPGQPTRMAQIRSSTRTETLVVEGPSPPVCIWHGACIQTRISHGRSRPIPGRFSARTRCGFILMCRRWVATNR